MIDSILAQTYENWKLVMIDDGSDSEETFNFISTHFNDERIIIKKQEHCGKIGKIKNKCIDFLNDCTYLISVDADDKLAPDALELYTKAFEENQCGVVIGNFDCFDDNGKTWSFSHVKNSGPYNPETLLKYMNHFPARAVLKEIRDVVGGYDEELTSAIDYDLALRLDEITNVYRVQKPLYFYRQHNVQVSRRKRQEQDKNAKIALERALKRRGIDGVVKNTTPPFVIEREDEGHFIWPPKEL
jgi:glycosyltransferase involved in cell wall biosynthesis